MGGITKSDYDRISVLRNHGSRMALLQEKKHEIINAYQVHETDTGSADVQVAMLTERISKLSEHLKANKKTILLVGVF